MTDTEELAAALKEFCAAAVEKGDFASPAKRDHQLHDAMAQAVTKLRSFGGPGSVALRTLLKHESQHVRSWAATELLAAGDEAARPVLEALTSKPGLVGSDAKIVLREYESGRLRSPFGTKCSLTAGSRRRRR